MNKTYKVVLEKGWDGGTKILIKQSNQKLKLVLMPNAGEKLECLERLPRKDLMCWFNNLLEVNFYKINSFLCIANSFETFKLTLKYFYLAV